LSLKTFLRIDLDRPVTIAGDFDPPSSATPDIPSLEKTALDRRPEIAAARASMAVYRDLYRLTWAEFQPSLGAFGSYQWSAQATDNSLGGSQQTDGISAGLLLRFNLFQGGQSFQRMKQSRFDWEKSRLEAEKTERNIRREVWEKGLALNEARDRVRVQRESVDEARKALTSVEVRYGAGQSGQLELNDATFALNRARLQQAQALSDYWTDKAALERAVGMPLEEMKP
jgi:outer membrane protein TolC